jgi:hypothetical protein
MDGHFLNEKHNWIIPGIGLGFRHLMGTSFINKEGTAFGVSSFTVFGHLGVPGDLTTSTEYMFGVAQDIQDMTFSGQVSFNPSMSGTYRLNLLTNTGRDLIVIDELVTGGQDYTFDFNYTFDAFAGETFFLVGGILFFPLAVTNYNETSISLSFRSRYRTTYIKGLRPAWVLQKLLDKITGGGYAISTGYLGNDWDNLVLTSGDAIRGLPGAKLKISMSEFLESYNIPCNISWGIRNNIFYVEKKENAFQPTIQYNLGEVNKLVISPAKDYHYNVVKVGYPNTDTNDVNGRDEFNVTVTYTSPVTKVNRVLDLVSTIGASMYEIEITRINLDGKTTTDSNNDNRNYFLHIEKTETVGTGNEPALYFKLLRNTYTSVTGLLNADSSFNLELHPELCLKRHGNYLRGVFYWNDSGSLTFQQSDKNGNVVVMNGTQVYIGNKSINIGSLSSTPLFIPLTFKCESPIGSSFISAMDNGPDGTFALTYDGFNLYGFPMDVGIQPATRPAQESILLCSPATDISNLITFAR